ncbi:MAG: hypothetical protein Q8M07_32105 [Prosthecobacter sp.]|nr:hypothetical protein [Prosthecobacter sp.]
MDKDLPIIAESFPFIEYLHLHGPLQAASLDALKPLLELNRITFTAGSFSAAHARMLEGVAHATKLKKLELINNLANDDAWHALAGLSFLEELILSGARIEERHLAILAGMKQLRKLVIENARTPIAEESLSRLRTALPECQVIVKPVPGTAPRQQPAGFALDPLFLMETIPHSDEAPVFQDPKLTREIAGLLLSRGSWIHIRADHKSELKEIKDASQLPSTSFHIERAVMRSIDAKPMPFSEEELLRIASLPRLETLADHRSASTRYSKEFFATMAANPSLIEMIFPDSGATDAHLAPFSTRTNIRLFALSHTAVSTSGLISSLAASAQNIEVLAIGGSGIMPDRDMPEIVGAFPKLQHLRIYGQAVSETLSGLAKLELLKSLRLDTMHLTEKHLKAIASLQESNPLNELGFVVCTLSNGAWTELGEMTFLTRLSVQVMALPPQALNSMGRLTRLKNLSISDVKPALTAEQIAGLKAALPKCQVVVEKAP